MNESRNKERVRFALHLIFILSTAALLVLWALLMQGVR